MSKALENELFTTNSSMFKSFLTARALIFFYQNNFKKSNVNKNIRTTKFLRKIVVSTPLISFQRNPLNTINYASMGQQVCWLFIFAQ